MPEVWLRRQGSSGMKQTPQPATAEVEQAIGYAYRQIAEGARRYEMLVGTLKVTAYAVGVTTIRVDVNKKKGT